MKNYVLFLIIIFLSSSSLAQNTQVDSSQTLEDVLVKETYKAGFEEDKLPVDINIDFAELLQIPEHIHWTSIDKIDALEEGMAWDSFTLNLSFPELANILPEPVKIFRTEFKNLSRWRFEVYSSDGTLFRSYEGKGNPPKYISWDGRDDNGQSFVPGRNYSSGFTAIDKAGNKRVFQGEVVSVPAVYLTNEKGISIAIATSSLFSEDGFSMLDTADEFAREVASLIRYYSSRGNIKAQSSHAKSDNFLKIVAKNLIVDAGSITRKAPQKGWEDCIVLWIE